MIEHMVANFAFLIDRIGFIPNGNRSYYCSRSQQPFFALMVELLAEARQDDGVYTQYLTHLEREYDFWMAGADQLEGDHAALRHVVRVGDSYLNRYWDDSNLPRQESHVEDAELATTTTRNPGELFRDIRAACESGWDFSARWLQDADDLASIRASRIVPVDLNALMYKLECTLAKGFQLAGNQSRQAYYQELADTRSSLIQSLLFDRDEGFYTDLVLPDLGPSDTPSVAAAYPLFFNIATQEQAARVDSLRRMEVRLSKVRSKLDGTVFAGAFIPRRPRGMHHRTYIRLDAEYREIEREMWRKAVARFGGPST